MIPRRLVTLESTYTVRETVDRIVVFLQDQGVEVYARINEQYAMGRRGVNLPPLENLFLARSVQAGMAMQHNPLSALEFPLKVVVWGELMSPTKVAFYQIDYLLDDYTIPEELVQTLDLEPMIRLALGAGASG